ncbi:LysR family transcriptional regulator [Halopseudomonas salegens]|uniref:Transcriptional regulator, LysR family n=1 Tax=Halopseudomonas salegens TaxID=1434072 RepID=A0A1H2FVR3_9GAMM|nr:LysR family transcriptional regulator [Halopseudomonas salegens]SDU11445.1 transcriptional regulator, LysR family [Halopseudomonas salegens]
MDIRQLQFLIALDDTRHFGQAAERCHVTQPTLSMRLRQLEEQLGLTLVQRDQRFHDFTPEGKRILAWARSLMRAHDGLLAEAAACRGQLIGTLRLGMVPLAGFNPARLLALWRQEYPELSLQLTTLSSEQILEQLASNQLDLGLGYLNKIDPASFASLTLAMPTMGLLFAPAHVSPPSDSPNWQEVARLPLGLLSSGMHFRQAVEQALRSRGLRANLVIESDAVQQLLHSVRYGLCCSVIPYDADLLASNPDLNWIAIAESSNLAPIGLLIRRQKPTSVIAQTCFNAAKPLEMVQPDGP